MIEVTKPTNKPTAPTKILSDLSVGDAFMATTSFSKDGNEPQIFVVAIGPDGIKKVVYRLASKKDLQEDTSTSKPFTTLYCSNQATPFFNYRPVNLSIIAEYE